MRQRYPSEGDIAEMRARGYDQSVIDEAIALSIRRQLLEKVSQGIQDAFANVQLGSGVGLWEGQAIDGYANDATQAKHRERDEKVNWQAIPVKDLNECNSSLSFFDAAGMRFHLPAFLIADLDGTYDYGVAFSLTQVGYELFSMLSEPQIMAVRDYLRFIENEPDYEFDREHIQRALVEFWGVHAA